MATMDRLPRTSPALIARPSLAVVAADAAVPEEDLQQAEQLIADLTALVDAGMIVARRQLGGPVRYAPVGEDDEAASPPLRPGRA